MEIINGHCFRFVPFTIPDGLNYEKTKRKSHTMYVSPNKRPTELTILGSADSLRDLNIIIQKYKYYATNDCTFKLRSPLSRRFIIFNPMMNVEYKRSRRDY